MVECEYENNILLFSEGESFNRYMVECELKKHLNPSKPGRGFNRYMVECEFLFLVGACQRSMVLIDIWWNVNEPEEKVGADAF